MALPGLFPLYPDPIPMKYQVSLGLPPLPVSEITKSIGITSSSSFLVPNIEYLQKFIEGDLGIADKAVKETLYKNFNDPIAQNNDKVFKSYASLNQIDIPDINKYKVDGKIKFPKEDVTAPNLDGIGFKAFEKTIMTSIFETQKPYLEVAKLVIANVAKIEDITARVMPLLGVPLKTKSLKPTGNSGAGDRPKAIGYQNGDELKKALSQLQTLTNQGSKIKIDKNGNATQSITPTGTASVSGNGDNTNWQILSSVYSTGKFIPGIDYQYTYIDLPSQTKNTPETADLNLGDDDPYSGYKPERIILGIFRSDGTPLDPNEYLKTIGSNGNNITYNETNFKRADWVLKSPKWHLPPYLSDTRSAIYSWPAFGSPTYKWKGPLLLTQDSKTKPADGWEIMKYEKGDKNVITGDDAIEGDPIITGFDTNQINEYKSYFTDTVKYKMNQSDGLEQTEKDQYSNEIISKLNIQSHLQNVYLYGQSKSSVYKQINNKPAYPESLKISFKPFQIYSASASQDVNLAAYNKSVGLQPGFIWIDPESDYETKIIRVDPTTKIAFEEGKGQPQISSTIKSFVKNKASFSISNGQNFNIDIQKNGLVTESFTNVNQYVLENWNYNSDTNLPPENRFENTNFYNISIWSTTPTKDYVNKSGTIELNPDSYYRELVRENDKWLYKSYIYDSNGDKSYVVISDGDILLNDNMKTRVRIQNGYIIRWYYAYNRVFNATNLPAFGKGRNLVLNYTNDLDSNSNLIINTTDTDIPLYQLKVENSDFPYGKIIDPSKITNDNLIKDQLFSKGKYGHGDAENPQEIEVIQRYMLTDLDTESYYIIEGVLTEKNTQTDTVPSTGGAASGGGYYRLPHALGATKVFLSLLVDIFSKLIPQITKMIALFKNPGSFIIDIIQRKLGEGFSIFSKQSFDTFEKAKSISNKKVDSTNRVSDKVNRLKDTFKNSPLSNVVYVDKKGNYKFLLDGVAMLPFEMFGLSIPFGADLNFSNLPDVPIKLITDVKTAKAKNIQDFLKPKLKEFNGPGSTGVAPTGAGKLAPGLNISDIKSIKDDPIYNTNVNNGKTNPNDYQIIDVKYSTGSYINGVNYNYIYINQDEDKILTDANNLVNTPNEAVDLPKAQKTLQDLNDAQKKDPTNEAIKDMINKLKNKLANLSDNTQPIIKMLLGFVTIPVKIIGGIISWLMDFFKSLTNPLTLPAKIAELLSFSWLMKFFTPIGMMELIGFKFEPAKLAEWLALVKVPSVKPPNISPKIPDGFDLPSAHYYKDATPKGRFLIPDDFDIADLNMVIAAPFIPKLPTYTARQFRENPTRPIKLILPFLCFFEKIINGIIDFIWSTLGIEALIPAPHIKLCSNSVNPSISDAVKIADDLKKTGTEPVATGGTFSNGSSTNIPTDAGFLYDITLDNGTVVKGLNYEEMQKYIKDHENIGYDFKF